MPWFPVNPTDGLTQSRFTNLTATEMGHVFRGMMYWWLHGCMPPADDEMLATASDRSRAVAEAWIQQIHAEQVAKFNAVSERNRENASRPRSTKSDAYLATASDRKRPQAVVSHREGEVDREGEGKTTTTARFALPDWVPADAWKGYLEVRQKKRAPSTVRALTGIVRKLEALKAQGFDPGQVLDQSTERGYTGVFPIRSDNGTGVQNAAPKSPASRNLTGGVVYHT